MTPAARAPRPPCRTLDEIRAAADADSAGDPPLTQDQADYVAAILAPYQDAARAA